MGLLPGDIMQCQRTLRKFDYTHMCVLSWFPQLKEIRGHFLQRNLLPQRWRVLLRVTDMLLKLYFGYHVYMTYTFALHARFILCHF